MMMILALNRDFDKMEAHFRRNIWYGSGFYGDPSQAEIQGKTLGLIGYGHIGKEVASRARAFGMKLRVINAYPPARKPRHIEFFEGPSGLHELLKASDFIVVACPANEKTRGLIGKREFTWMKRTACLINVARGPIVQEKPSTMPCVRGGSRARPSDVWYQYPTDNRPCAPSRFPFHKLDNLIMTPHVFRVDARDGE